MPCSKYKRRKKDAIGSTRKYLGKVSGLALDVAKVNITTSLVKGLKV